MIYEIDTYSVNSIKLLQKSPEQFKEKYIEGTEFFKRNEGALTGNIFHALISYYLKNYTLSKFENFLRETVKENEAQAFFDLKKSEIMKFILESEEKFIEQPFFVKLDCQKSPVFLTGRFDIVVRRGGKYTIIDWKTKTLPKNPENDVQTMVYTYALSKLAKTNEIEMIYYSILDKKQTGASFQKEYAGEIESIIHNCPNFRPEFQL